MFSEGVLVRVYDAIGEFWYPWSALPGVWAWQLFGVKEGRA